MSFVSQTYGDSLPVSVGSDAASGYVAKTSSFVRRLLFTVWLATWDVQLRLESRRGSYHGIVSEVANELIWRRRKAKS